MSDFANQLIAWQQVHGRHDLPWQNTPDPYAIWVSEIMLQQTQVAAVIQYYQRFMQRFPTIASLAAAPQEEVMQYWSGLGYYSRARNMLAAAIQVIQKHQGQFPTVFEDVLALPGIGRSTAAAILSFAFDQPHPILDGNVKRVFARHFLIEGWPGQPKVEQQMWQLAEQLIPNQGMVAYTQGLMDLGATICTRSKPKCMFCPVQSTCLAYQTSRCQELPASKPRKAVPEKSTAMLLLVSGNEILLEKRPQKGIWGGLWSLPELGNEEDGEAVALTRFGLQVKTQEVVVLPVVTHTFTHFRLYITPKLFIVQDKHPAIPCDNLTWLRLETASQAALPAPIKKLLIESKLAVHHNYSV